jgi:hypothetical protein
VGGLAWAGPWNKDFFQKSKVVREFCCHVFAYDLGLEAQLSLSSVPFCREPGGGGNGLYIISITIRSFISCPTALNPVNDS